MRGALDLTTDYARARRQYGAAIGSFQAVQHLLADAFVAVPGSRSITLHAAWAVDALPAAGAALAAARAARPTAPGRHARCAGRPGAVGLGGRRRGERVARAARHRPGRVEGDTAGTLHGHEGVGQQVLHRLEHPMAAPYWRRARA